MSDVIITEFMDQAAVDDLKKQYTIKWQDDLWSRPADLREHVHGARALIVRNRTQVNRDLLQAAPALKVVARLGVGLDNIDLDACKARNIEVCPAVGANAASVAEYVMACAMMLLRGGALSGTAQLQGGAWPRQQFSSGREIAGKVLGIIGYGSIGQTTGQRARALGMEVIAHDEALPATSAAWQDMPSVSLEDLVKRADVITLHCPLTQQTRALIDAPMLARMKPGAILINAARGGIVDEAACADALRAGHLGGAAIDVFDTEPIDAHASAHFRGINNVILTPHIAGVTVEANQRASAICVSNVRRVLGQQTQL